jgi:hypothetical protein
VHHPSQYSGKNLAKLGKHFVDDATLLESAGQYDHNLMLHMVKIFIREHEIADITKKARIYTILSEIFTLCLCF